MLKIEYVDVSTLKRNPRNPRRHSHKQIGQIAHSIETFRFNVPILIDANSQVIAGHGRVLACEHLGLKEVPAIRIEHLTPDQLRAFTIVDNRLTENSEWDDRLLAEELKNLSEAELDFNIEVTGFEVAEIDLVINNLDAIGGQAADPADALPAPSAVKVSQAGDLWVLGKHRVLCGNALLGESYEMVMNGEKARIVFADPPYNVPIAANVSGHGKYRHHEFLMGAGEMAEGEFTRFLQNTFIQLVSFSHNPSLHYVCSDWRHLSEMVVAGRVAYDKLNNLCVWAKDNAGLGSFYRSQHELIFVFQRGNNSRNNVQLGRYGRSRTNVWRYPSSNSFASDKKEGDLLAIHPTVKPVALVADAIQDCTARGDVILDPFLGSGTTVIAAERTGRICYGLELDPIYVDTMVRRWQRFTGKPGIHVSTGRSFDDQEKEMLDAGRL